MEFKTIEMLRTMKGSPDGVTVRTYIKGEVYDLPKSLAVCFIKDLACAVSYEPSEEESDVDKGSDD